MFNSKIKLGVIGRQETFNRLNNSINSNDKTIWFHCASLGEYEQGFPLFVEIKKKYPNHKLVLSFFSPSGYEVKKANSIADVVVYLPIDTKDNCEKFLDLIKPEIVVFIKSEIWPNYLNEIKKRNIKSILVCAIYNSSQMKYGLLKKAVLKFDYIFTQDEKSKDLFKSIGHNNVFNSGDTRFDRVSLSKNLNEDVDYINEYLSKKDCLIAGSTWGTKAERAAADKAKKEAAEQARAQKAAADKAAKEEAEAKAAEDKAARLSINIGFFSAALKASSTNFFS